MRVQLESNFGCARGCATFSWFNDIWDAMDYCEKVIKTYWPAQNHAKALRELHACGQPQELTELMTNACLFKFTWVK